MEINTNNLRTVTFNNQLINWIKFNGQKIWGGIKTLIARGTPPISINGNGADIVSYKIYGNTGGVGNAGASGYEIPITVSGVNLVDYTQAQPRNSSATVTIDTERNGVIWSGSYFFKIPCSIPAGKVISCDVQGEYTGKWAIQYRGGTIEPNTWLYNPFTTTEEVSYVYIYKTNPTTTGTDMLFYDIIVNYGETALPYEPYFEPVTETITVTQPLGEGEFIDSTTYPNAPTLPSFNGTTIYDVETEIKPSNMEIEYEA